VRGIYASHFLFDEKLKKAECSFMLPAALKEHAFKPGERVVGRSKGTPNALTVSVREAIERAFDRLGGASYLEHVGRTDPRTFCALLSKLLPTKLANADGSPLLAALTELTDAQLEARTARALADAHRQGLMVPVGDVIEVQAEAVQPTAVSATTP
jgi:hypothetical protein